MAHEGCTAVLPMRGAFVFAAVACLAAGAQADWLPDWSLGGYNTLRAEYYQLNGDRAASPYPHAGGQFHNELGLDLNHRVSPWESVHAQLSGVANASDYRSGEHGGVLERGRLRWEKGDASVPFRLEAGDYYAAQGPRTLQRGLKGLQLEFQPGAGQSLQLFGGYAAPVYRNVEEDQGAFSGVSWLMEGEALGALSLAAVHHRRGANAGQAALSQEVASLAWYKPWQLGGHDLEFEAELANFSGGYDVGGAPARGGDDARFAQLAGRAAPLGYRIRYERQGNDFRPAGGALTPDHRGVEGHVAWSFASGLQLRGRLQSFRDALESANPLDTDVAGLSLAGPPWAGSSLYASLDAFAQDRRDRARAVDSETLGLALNLSAPLARQISARGGLSWTGTDDRVAGRMSVGRQLNLALDTPFSAGSWRGGFSPGLVLRRNTGGADSSELNPTLALRLSRDRHSLRLAHNWFRQDGHAATSIDTDIQQSALAYDYRYGQHRLGLEVDRFDRDPDTVAATEAWRLSAYWSVAFDRPPRRLEALPAARMDGAGPATLPSLLELRPGLDLAVARDWLARGRLVPAYRLPGIEIFEARLLDEIDLRQRLALLHDAGGLDATALVMDFEDTGNAAGMARDYARVRDLLLRRYGAPRDHQEEGVFGPNLAAELGMGRFRRLLEWRTESGRLRFGIPQRLDGLVRMEILHAPNLPTTPNWGIEALR